VLLGSAAGSEDRPILMLDTGGHQALINDVVFTPDGKLLVSAGDDKVVRVWDWQTGKTIRTIRGQIGPGQEGNVYAMALSPNGRWLALGGWMAPGHGVRDDDVGDIRVYDFMTGELQALLKGHHGAVHALAFSPDSKRLISGSADHNAMIWDVEARRPLLAPLRGHDAEIYRVAFMPDGARVVTASDDGTVRLWNVARGTMLKVMLGHNDKVRALAVSRAGATIASGDGSGEIRFWDGRTGNAVGPAAFARQGGPVGSLSFSPDGRLLLATCGPHDCQRTQRIFDVSSGQELVGYKEHVNSVYASAFSPLGDVVATGGGEYYEIDVWDPRTGGTKATMRGAGRTVRAVAFSADGGQFAWGSAVKYVNANDRGPLQMRLVLPSVGEPIREPEPVANPEGWVRAQTQLGSWSLRHSGAGKSLDDYNVVLDILQDGQVRASIPRDSTSGKAHFAYGFTPDGAIAISAGDGVLTAYNRDGGAVGNFIGHEYSVLALAVSPNGKYLVSGSADQTVRLWDVKNRELLATLLYGTDGEWVMWTPEGFYTSSNKGASRVGWQINRGPDRAADYVTGEQLRDTFFRPDLVAAKIAGDPDGKVAQAAAQLNIDDILKSEIAPDVSLTKTEVQDATVTVTARIVDKGGGIGRIAWRVNGQPVASDFGTITLNHKGEITRSFDLAFVDNTIEVTAENKSGKVTSKLASAAVKADPQAIKGVPKLYVLAVGVNAYRDTKRLNFAVADAELLSKTIVQAGKDYYRIDPNELEKPEKQIVVLLDGQVTVEAVSAKFKELSAKIKAGDVFLFFIAGHGKTINSLEAGQKPEYYFVPGSIESFTDETIRAQGFGPKQWQEWSEEIKAQKSIWIFDTCESGSVSQVIASRATVSEIDTAQQQMKDAVGRSVFMAASDQDVANEGYNLHGLLTYALLEGLAKAGDGQSRMIDLYDLGKYVQIKVPQYSLEMKKCYDDRGQQRCQRPQVLPGRNDYPVVPRYAAVLQQLRAGGAEISRTPTHVVIVAADLLGSAMRGGDVKRQLDAGTAVTLIKTEGEWAYVAKDGTALGYVLQSELRPLH
jgi:WD40 repeat protein/uncharacterized caspase-like protein